jgi:hypothetical protein
VLLKTHRPSVRNIGVLLKTHRPSGLGGLDASAPDLGETRPLSQGVQAGSKALRIRHIHGVKMRKEVRRKRPRGFK